MLEIDFGQSDPIVGIDLGTTNSLISILESGTPRIIGGILPSTVTLPPNLPAIIGDRQALIDYPHHSVYSAKRLMGRNAADVANEIKLLPFTITADSDTVLRIQLGTQTLTPPEVAALILRRLKDTAELDLGTPVTKAVITVPAYFNDAQRQATKDAGRIAGLEVLRLVNEPTAAALAYGLDKRKEGIVAVYDFGGGTFDISILRLRDGIFEVLATNGDTHLGGDDIDNLLLQIAQEDLASEGHASEGHALSDDPGAVQTLRQEVIRAKEALSFAPAATISHGESYSREITRELFERLITPIVDRTLAPCRACLADAHLTPEQIDEVVLVGGSTRIPLVRSAVEVLFRAKPHTDLNPDEVVALGAAVQAGILAGTVENQLLLDVTPLSLGIETMGGVVSKIITRNSTIPASATESFTTSVDGQTNVLIHVLQGERELVKDCRPLARFDLKGIDPVPAGLARIEVRFLIDANGILSVTARDARTGKETSVEVKPTYGLTDTEVEAMIQSSFDNAQADLDARQVAEARLDADTILAAIDKAKRTDAYSELPENERSGIATALNQLLLVYHSDDHRLIRKKIDELNEATTTLAGNMMNTAVRGALKGTKIT